MTIAIPAFGESPFLKEAIESVIRSQDINVKIIVIDDCSPTTFIKDICSLFEDRITYIRNDTNLGISENFNKCIRASNSEFVQLLGQDDVLVNSMIDVINSCEIDRSTIFGIHPKVRVVNKNGNYVLTLSDFVKRIIKPKPTGIINGNQLRSSLIIGNWTYFPSIIWNKRKIEQHSFSDELFYCQDYAFLFKLCDSNLGLFCSNTYGVKYRRHSDSQSMSNSYNRFLEEKYIVRSQKKRTFLDAVFIKILLTPRLNLLLSKLSRKRN